MQILDKRLFELIEKLINEYDRKNIAASNYWYPLNYATFGAEEITSSLQSMISFRTSMSEKCKLFEEMFSDFINSNESIFLNSGSSADLLAMTTLVKSPEIDIQRGDKVLVPAITWPTQVWSILQAGLIPVLYDCSPKTFNPDIKTVPKEVLKKCKIIFTTHILGTCCDLDELQNYADEYQLIIAEDACESLGTTYRNKQVGTFGLVGTFSSFFSHHLTTMEGGILCSNNEDIINQAKIMRAHGWARSLQNNGLESFCTKRNIKLENFKDIDPRYLFLDEGYNLRPTEINASFGIHQIEKLDYFNKIRKDHSRIFYEELSKLKNIFGPEIVDNCSPCFMALPMTIKSNNFDRSKAIQFLEYRGVEARPLIAGNLLKHPVNKLLNLKSAQNNFDGADFHHNQSLYVGLSPKHTKEDIKRLINICCDLDNLISS